MLRSHWSKEKFIHGAGLKTIQNEDVEVSIEKVDAILTSNSFWAKLATVHSVAAESDFIGQWCEGCACHSDDTGSISACSLRCLDVDCESDGFFLFVIG